MRDWQAAAMLLLALLIFAFIATVIVLADSGRLGFLYRVYDFPYGDKAGHTILFGLLTFFIQMSLFQLVRRRPANEVAWFAAVAITILITLEELSQVWMPNRRLDWLDLVAGYTGVIGFSLLAVSLNDTLRRKARQVSEAG